MLNQDIYFAADEADTLVDYLTGKSNSWFHSLTSTDYLEKIKKSWSFYHGMFYMNSHGVTFGGESGELANLPVNHYRNLASHIITIITSTRPSFQARAVNTDVRSQIQTQLANGLLEYYMREKKLEVDLKAAVEYAVVLGTGYIKMEWNSTAGEIYDITEPEVEIDPETGEETVIREGYPIYEGDVEFTVLSPYDVVFDPTKENPKQDWQLCRTFKNKYDLAAKYPEFADDIKKLETKSDSYKYRLSLTPYDQTMDIPVYEFFHKPTEALPKGRYVLYLCRDIVLMDTVLPYKNLPIFRISPANIIGTPYGYTQMFDLMPLQESINSLYSTVLTNQSTFGVQNVYITRDANINFSELSGGLNVIEGDPGAAPPIPLNLTQTPVEIFNFINILRQDMETLSGINAVARGNLDPKSSLRSGNALALLQANALQFVSGLQQSYIQLIEDVGTNLIQLLKDFAAVPRIAYISGKSNHPYMKEFSGDDLSYVNRVIVDAGNALSQTVAGRVEMASQLMQMQAIKTPEEYLSVINTGKLETMTEGDNKELLLIRAERERIVDGTTPVMAVLTDAHNLHIREHKAILADPDLRMDVKLVQRTLAHIQEHLDILRNPDVADILVMIGEQPLTAPGGTPNAPIAPDQLNQSGQEQAANLLQNPEAQSVSLQQNMGPLPQPAQPAGNENMPVNGAQLFAQNTRG